jgi:hypothetical protein
LSNLSEIAGHFKKFGVTEEILCEWLGLKNPDDFDPGHEKKCRDWYSEYMARSKQRHKTKQVIRALRESLNIEHRRRK